jgi:acetyl-CoA C-acetyltransferase
MNGYEMAADDMTRVCIVGTARHTWRDESQFAPEPLSMWESVSRLAIDDAGTTADVAAQLDHLAVVHTQSWDYDNPVARLGERLGRDDLNGVSSLIAGTSPQRLIDQAAAAMMRGEISAALIVGAEAQSTVRRMERSGEGPNWSHTNPNAVSIEASLGEWYLPTELRHGVLPAWLTFALLGQARWAARGAKPADRQAMFQLLSSLSNVAAHNPDSWYPLAHTAERLAHADARNRPIATPFNKLTTAFPFVDMAAANLLVTDAVADQWKIPEDRRIYLRGWGFARDASHIAGRESLSSSPAMRSAFSSALTMAGLRQEEITAFDLYSCFGSAVQFARDALELADNDPRPISLTGGLPYHGGPGSNYMNHSISTLVDFLRENPNANGMVTGIGMHMTKHVAGVWSATPGKNPLPTSDEPQLAVLDDDAPGHTVQDTVTGSVTIESASVIYGREGEPVSVIAICSLPDGSRCYATTDAPDAMSAVVNDEWVGAAASVAPTDAGTNWLSL